MLRYLLTFLFVIAVTVSFAQSKKKKAKKAEGNTSSGQATSLAPYYPQKNYEPSKKKTGTWKVRYDNKAHEKRMAQVAKEDRKNRKEMAKPENSDPLYFGHKRPPKKRPPSKMKFCKVCGIRH